jgi:hypothetical protein
MPKYITWDNVIDIFLTKSFAASVINNNANAPTAAKSAQPVSSDDQFPEP